MAKIQDQRPAVLTCSNDTSVVALRGQDPTCCPVFVHRICSTCLVVGYLDALIIRAGHYTAVEGIQEQ